ncbi:MAG: hypothetical protein U0232_22010 [Thermomicrobiales bacterium]
MIARQEAQQQLDAALSLKQRLVFQRSQLDKRNRLYRTRASGIDMQLEQAELDISAAQSALASADAAEGEE